jgi:hypothetical protein
MCTKGPHICGTQPVLHNRTHYIQKISGHAEVGYDPNDVIDSCCVQVAFVQFDLAPVGLDPCTCTGPTKRPNFALALS